MRSSNSIKTHEVPQPIPVFLEALTAAIPRLKNQLQQNYKQAYPDLGDIIAFVIKAEEVEAWRFRIWFYQPWWKSIWRNLDSKLWLAGPKTC